MVGQAAQEIWLIKKREEDKKKESSLSSIVKLKKKYKVNVGFSDHTIGNYASCLAVSLGATIIEKHFTYDKKRDGHDHKIALDYKGMNELVKKVRLTEEMLDYKRPNNKKRDNNRKKFLRVLVAEKKILKGTVFSKNNISINKIKLFQEFTILNRNIMLLPK